MCNSGWGGADCSEVYDCMDDGCQNGGVCNTTTGVCSCDATLWVGTYCEYAICPGYNDRDSTGNCLFRGSCNASTHACNCLPGFTGTMCDAFYCPNGCSGNGQCVADSKTPMCFCNEGYEGDDCSLAADVASGTASGNGDGPSYDASVGIAVGISLSVICVLSIILYATLRRKRGQSALPSAFTTRLSKITGGSSNSANSKGASGSGKSGTASFDESKSETQDIPLRESVSSWREIRSQPLADSA